MMNVLSTKLLFYTILTLKYLPNVQKDERQRWVQYCHDDYMKCPNCFNDDNSQLSCDTFLDNVEIESSFDSDVSGLFGNRKIQYGKSKYDEQKVILKYLINDDNFDHLKQKCCNNESDCEIVWNDKSHVERLKTKLRRVFEKKESVAGFQICPAASVAKFMAVFSQQTVYAWLLLNLNVEPLIMDTLTKNNFSVPTLHGSCGFVTLQSNNGLPLYSFYDESFAVRLLIARNLLLAALKFSYGVEGFRIYLTDATPDNIVVDENTFEVTFVDLDNAFLVDSKVIATNQNTHRHEKIHCDGMCFAYVPEELCSYHLSDINLFAICQLFVEDPHRMPDKGLVDSVPDTIANDYPDLERLINQCVHGNVDRFGTVDLLLKLFNKILTVR